MIRTYTNRSYGKGPKRKTVTAEVSYRRIGQSISACSPSQAASAVVECAALIKSRISTVDETIFLFLLTTRLEVVLQMGRESIRRAENVWIPRKRDGPGRVRRGAIVFVRRSLRATCNARPPRPSSLRDNDGERSEGRHGRRRRRRRGGGLPRVGARRRCVYIRPDKTGLCVFCSLLLCWPPLTGLIVVNDVQRPPPSVLNAHHDVSAPTISLVHRAIASHQQSRQSGLSIPHKPRLSRISASFSISSRLPAFRPPHPHPLCRHQLLHDESSTRQSLTTPAIRAQYQPSYSQCSFNIGWYTSPVTTSNPFIRCSAAVNANVW